MSWRRFATLLRGLGPQSASASRAVVRRYQLHKDSDTVTVTGSKEQVTAAFSAQFGGLAAGHKKRPSGGAKGGRAPG